MAVMPVAVHLLGSPLAAVLTAICAIMLLTCPNACAGCDNLNARSPLPSRAPSLSFESTRGFGLHVALLASDSFIDLSWSADYSGADFDSPPREADSAHAFIFFSTCFAGPTALSKLRRLLFRMADIPPPHLGG
ncbi:MAG: hypothetical protein GX600_10165 [Dehalococcoidia bacterium]|nr:hypothetical protein [Dehalococcoidia bacterium]